MYVVSTDGRNKKGCILTVVQGPQIGKKPKTHITPAVSDAHSNDKSKGPHLTDCDVEKKQKRCIAGVLQDLCKRPSVLPYPAPPKVKTYKMVSWEQPPPQLGVCLSE